MDGLKFGKIAHRDHAHLNPLNEAKLERMIGLLDLSPGQRVLDVGCGRGEILIRMVERFGVSAVGIDLSEPYLTAARATAKQRVPSRDVSFVLMDVANYGEEPGRFDLAMSIGGPAKVLPQLVKMVRSGGKVILGETYWKREPDPRYLEVLGVSHFDMTDHADTVLQGLDFGLNYHYSLVASEDDWDHYEGLYSRSIERYAVERPEDPDLPAMLKRSRQWRETYLKWGRDTLGFGVYLFQKP